jgi:hypothetical protein
MDGFTDLLEGVGPSRAALDAANREMNALRSHANVDAQRRRRRFAPGEGDILAASDTSSIASEDEPPARRVHRNPRDDEAIEDNGPNDPGVGAGGRRLAPSMERVLHELGHPQPPHLCFGCTHARTDTTSIAYEPMHTMETLFRNKMCVTDDIAIAKIMKAFFDKSIRIPANANRRDDEEEIPEWSAATIYMHYRHHMLDFSTRRMGRLSMLDELIRHQYSFLSAVSSLSL